VTTTSATTRTRLPIEEMLTLACRAPSIQNTQPWLWRFSGDQLDLYADFSRQLSLADPTGRDLILSCGAALHHLQVAAAGLGWSTQVTRMPHEGDPHHLATIRFEPVTGTPDAYIRMLAISSRRTDRRPVTDWSVPQGRLTQLAEEGQQWGALVTVVDDATRERLTDLTLTAHLQQQADLSYLQEEAAARQAHPEAHGTRPAPQADAADRMLLIATAADDTLSRLRAGEALSALWLLAEEGGLIVVPLSQGVEVDNTYRTLQENVLGGRSCPQILLRVGWLHEGVEPLPATSRRPLEEVLVRHEVPRPVPPWPRGTQTGPEWRGKPV